MDDAIVEQFLRVTIRKKTIAKGKRNRERSGYHSNIPLAKDFVAMG